MLIIVNKNPSAFFTLKPLIVYLKVTTNKKIHVYKKKSVKLAIQRDTTAKIAHKIFILSHFPLLRPPVLITH